MQKSLEKLELYLSFAIEKLYFLRINYRQEYKKIWIEYITYYSYNTL